MGIFYNRHFYRAFLTLVSVFVFLSGEVKGQVATNSGSGLAPAYPSLAAAITALNGTSISSPVIIQLTGNETAPVGGYTITAQGTAVYTITIEGSASTITAGLQVAGSQNDAIFKIVGGDYITLQNFTLKENILNNVYNLPLTTNTMTEWGITLLSDATRTNGAQNNTIKNNIISLNSLYANSAAIYSSVLHLPANSPQTLTDITNVSGSNSNNLIYNNTINSVACPVVFVGSRTPAFMDVGNEIGGSTGILGNRITFWGNITANSMAADVSASVFGIYCNNQVGFTINNNTITSSTLNTTAGTRAILVQYTGGNPGGTFTNAITNNTITLQNGGVPATYEVISTQDLSLATATINITDNMLLNCTTGGVFTGIANASAPGTLSISRNSIKGTSSAATSQLFYGIKNTGAVVNTINILSNELGNSAVAFVTFSAANTGAFYGISNEGGAGTCGLSINGNTFSGITLSIAGSSAHTYIRNTAATLSQSINNNLFNALNVNTSGSLTFISNSVALPSLGSQSVINNSIVTSFTKTAGGTVYLYYSIAAGNANATIFHNLNDFSNITLSGATIMGGWSATGDLAASKTFSNNKFSNWNFGTGTGTITAMNINSGLSIIKNNTITNISGAGAITGIITGSVGSDTLKQNTIGALNSSGAVTVNGIVSSTPNSIIFGNKIYTLKNSLGGVVSGINIANGTTITLYNNIIGDLQVTNSNISNGLVGINIAVGGANVNAFFNTVWLNNGNIGIGTNFRSSAIFVNTASTVDLRNNIFVNTSSPGANAAAYRRSSSTTLTTYSVNSNNNLFYGGTPSNKNLIFADGTNGVQTLVAYKAWVGGTVPPRDAASITENPPFESYIGSNSKFLHISSGCTGTPTAIESGGTAISPPADDFDGELRFGSSGYTDDGFRPDIGADEFNRQIVEVSATAGTVLANYANLQNAFAKINDGTHKGAITIKLYCNTVETATAELKGSGGSASYTSVMIYPVITGLSISGDLAGVPLIDLNGADNVTINGSLNGTGTSADLTISNTSTGGTGTSTIRMQNDATGNTITYCNVLGSSVTTYLSSTAGGNIWIGSALASGNNNNTISNCNIGPAGINLPTKCIYLYETGGKQNSNILITGNNIYDYFSAANYSAGIYSGIGYTACSFTNNKLYQTADRTQTLGRYHYGIGIANTSGINFLVSGNTIGYSSSTGTGTYSLNGVGSGVDVTEFYPIYISVGGAIVADATSVQGNTIKAINCVNSGTVAAKWAGIFIANGLVYAGTVVGNTIGSAAGTGSIVITNSAGAAADVIGIKYQSGTSEGGIIQNSTIGSITAIGSATYPANFYGIYRNSVGTLALRRNTIGSTLTPESINAVTATANPQVVCGIYNMQVGSFDAYDNTIANLSNAYAGIGDGSIAGIWLTPDAASTHTERNFIHSLYAAPGSNIPVYGIRVESTQGVSDRYGSISNNIISLGKDITSGSAIYGIYENSAFISSTFYFNTVYISGNTSAGGNNTYALYSSGANLRNFRNNNLNNTRSGSGATHYAINLGNTADLTINYNNYYVSGGILGSYAGANQATLADWKSVVSDANSLSADPAFPVTNGIIANEFKPGLPQYGVAIISTTIDYHGSLRGDPPVIGALEGNTIITTSLVPSTICSGSTLTVNFSSNGTFAAGNIYTAQLSNASGSFVSPLNLASLTSTANTGAISVTIPPFLFPATGVGYKIRVISDNPVITNDAGTWLTINPSPIVPTQADTICSGTIPYFVPIDKWPNTVVPGGTTYIWSDPVKDFGIAGGSAQAVWQNSVNQALTNSTNTRLTATYNVTPKSGECPGTPFTLVVTVNPKPAINSIAATTCSNQLFTVEPVNGTNGVVPTGTTYSWSVQSADAGIIGAEAGSGGEISGTLNNSTAIVQSAIYTVTPLFEACPGSDFTVTVSVKPTPELSSATESACDGQVFSFVATSATAGTTFTWERAVVPGISNAASSGLTANISETLHNTQTYNIPVTYAFTLIANGCSNPDPQNLSVIVVPIPVVTASSVPAGGVCLAPPPSTLSMPFDLYSSSNLGSAQPNELLNENFETGSTGTTTGPNGWTTSITNAAGNPIVNATQWIIREKSYTTVIPVSPYLSVTISSNTNDKFFLADNTKTLGEVITSLISPAMSTIGYNTLTLDFWNYYRDKGPGDSYTNTDYGYIDVSTDNFTTYTTVQLSNGNTKYDETHGYPYSFAHETVDLTTFIGNTNLKFRFRYHPTNDFYWAIDNIKVTGTSPVQGFSWTSDPAGYVNTFNVSPTGLTQSATTTYIAQYQDISISANCPATGSVTVTNIIPTPPTISPSGTVTVCAYNNTTFTRLTGVGTMQWNLWGGAIDGATGSSYQTQNFPLLDYSATQLPRFSLTTTDANGCISTSAETTVAIPFIGNNTIGDAQIVCSGSPVDPLIQGPIELTAGNTYPGYTFQWQKSTTSATAGFANATGNLIDYTPTASAQTTWYRRLVGLTGCNYASNSVVLTPGYQWLGNSSAWNDPANWCGGGLPGAGSNVGIPAGAAIDPQVNITTAECNNLIINSAASMQINSGQALTVNGNLTNNGTFTINSGALDQNGSLIVKGTGTGNVIYNRYLTPSRWFIMSSPVNTTVTGFDGTQIVQNGSTDWDFAPYVETNNNGWAYQSTMPTKLTSGKGYLARLKTGTGNLSYTGALNTSDVTIPVTNTGTDNGWNAIGNPFTSAIGITDLATLAKENFLTVNGGILETNYKAIYLWYQTDGTGTGTETGAYTSGVQQYYRVMNNSGYLLAGGKAYGGPIADPYIQAGQGFLINVGGSGGNITFTKNNIAGTVGMQLHSPTLTMKSAQTNTSWPGITLLASNSGRTSSTIVAFNSNMTTGLDPSYDAGILSASDFNVYTHLVDGSNQTDFMVQCLPDTWNDTLAVPIGVDLPIAGLLTFKAAGVILPDGLYPVIEDRLLQLSVPLKTENDSLTVDVAEPSWGIGRFYLHIGGVTSTVGNSKLSETQKLSAYFAGQKIIVFGSPEQGSRAWLCDMSGRKLGGEYRLTSANRNEINAPGLSSGIYLLRIEGKTGMQTIKITVLGQ